MSDFYKKILDNNKKWVENKLAISPNYFKNLADGQNPPLLWIGCSDSRVPANEIIGAEPGEVFVHRNIANMVVHTDMNLLSVLDYAVNILKVKHVVVCGHYLCGGVKAAMGGKQNGIVDNWIRHIKDVYRLHEKELESISDDDIRFDRLVELNVYEQVFDLLKTSIIQNAWANSDFPKIHGWVFDIRTGFIKDLNITLDKNSTIPELYKIDSKTVSE